jgi:AraC family transcriptional activator of pobA
MLENIKKYKFENNHPLAFEILDLEKLTHSRKDKIYIPHRTNFYHIFFFEKCNPVHNIDFHSVKIKPYSLLFINKDSVHIFDSKSQYKGKLIIFTEDFFYQSENDRLFLQSTILFNDLLSTQCIELEKDNSEFSIILKLMELELKKEIDANQHYILKNFLHNLLLLSERTKRTSGYTELKKGLELDITIMFKDLMNEKFLNIENSKLLFKINPNFRKKTYTCYY